MRDPIRLPVFACLASAGWWLALLAPAAEPPAEVAAWNSLVEQAAAYQSGQDMTALRRLEALARQSVGNVELHDQVQIALTQLLRPSATHEARLFACQQLAIHGSDRALPALADLLKNDQTVGMACLALTTYPSAKASEVLREALPGLRASARAQVIQTLGDRRDPGAVKTLADLSRNQDKVTAEAAVVALGKMANEPARREIAALRKAADPALASAVAEASLRVAAAHAAEGNRPEAAAIYEQLLSPSQARQVRRGALAALLRLDTDGGEKRIEQIIRGKDVALKPLAIAGISALDAKTASAKFASQLPGLEPQEQVWLIEALADRRDPAALKAIRASLTASPATVRLAAIRAIGEIDDASAVPLLAKALAAAGGDEERLTIEEALVGLPGGDKVDQAISDQLKTATPEAKLRLIAALPRRGNRLAVAALLQETANSSGVVASAAFGALGRLGSTEDFPAVLARLADSRLKEVRAEAEGAAIQVLAKSKEPDSLFPLVHRARAQANSPEVLCSLLRLLPHCPGKPAFAMLREASASPDALVRETVVRTLAEWPDAIAWDPLMLVCEKPEKEAHRVLALRALTRLAREDNARPNNELMTRYGQLLSFAKGPDDFKLVLGALAGAAHPEALKLALPLLDNASVRAEAELAVKQIAEAIKETHPQAAQEALQKLKPPRQ
jgi:HEAT repeat protein